jgi:inner membrane protein
MSPATLWFILGTVLILAEFATPGVILVFIGLGAWVASLAAWLNLAESMGAQTLIFAVASVVLIVGLRRSFKSWFLGSSHSAGSQSLLAEYEGKTVRVIVAIHPPQQGKVEFKGSPWMAAATESFEVGEWVRVDSLDGLCLKVSRAAQ